MFLGIIISLLLLIFVAYRGYSVILFAPVCAILAVLFSPGTPQIQNLIPVKYFGATAYEASTMGIIGGAAMFLFGMIWLERRKASLISA